MDVNDYIMIIGDFNSRLGANQIRSEDIEKDNGKRRSEDKISNQEGTKLLKLGEELDLEVRTENTEGDWKGEATYVGDNAGSVID